MLFVKTEDRPALIFEVVRNKGERGRPTIKEGDKIIREGREGEKVELVEKALIDRVSNSPYVWATADWLMHRLAEGWVLVDVKNVEKLPANYPKDWREMLGPIVAAAQQLVAAGAASQQDRAALMAEVEALRAKLAAQEELQKAEQENAQYGEVATTEAAGKKSRTSNRLAAAEREGALAETGQAADA